ncbi:hypothetical protein PRUPE_6G237800 [Prunus persica]|uniref:Uncharacterized protein n=1 Tax=Prunus persica TaxID=3760 RepID=A0A251NUW2_PRUPE|nr:hypothetical protein PRUPE_6G237800 [Prunus persica]
MFILFWEDEQYYFVLSVSSPILFLLYVSFQHAFHPVLFLAQLWEVEGLFIRLFLCLTEVLIIFDLRYGSDLSFEFHEFLLLLYNSLIKMSFALHLHMGGSVIISLSVLCFMNITIVYKFLFIFHFLMKESVISFYYSLMVCRFYIFVFTIGHPYMEYPLVHTFSAD